MDELAALTEQITLQGNKVRDLKASNADKEVLDVEVKKLLQLKAKMPKEEKPKKEEKKVDERALKKEQRRLERLAKQQKTTEDSCPIVSDVTKADFGMAEILRSKKTDKLGRKFVAIDDLQVGMKQIWIRAYVHATRTQSKLSFVVLRQRKSTVQAVIGGKLSKFTADNAYNESVVDVLADVVAIEAPTKCSQSTLELQVSKIFVISQASTNLSFQVQDASRTEAEIEEMGENAVRVGLDTRLDGRCLDLRTPFSQSVMKITSNVLYSFRTHLFERGFIEICSPKLLGGASEGGAEVFQTNYFGKDAILAQSPQLHKQMSAACSGLERVFEVGPVFRAENSNTNRHLCEFTGLDMEMAIKEHYHEILDEFSDLFHRIFSDLENMCKAELEIIKQYYPFDDLVYEAPDWIEQSKIAGKKARTLRLEFGEAVELLRAAGVDEQEQPDYDDLSTPVEKKIGALVKEKYGVDFYFLDKFPLKPRPFYTMPCPENKHLSNSYDFFIRGQEIMSGAQRVHDAAMLEKRVHEMGIPVESLRFYIDSFKNGALPHGGGGVGLERVVMLFLGLPNIRLVRMFPRDPQRLMP